MAREGVTATQEEKEMKTMKQLGTKATVIAALLGAAWLWQAGNAAALTADKKCQSAVAKSTAKYAQARLKALQKCEDGRLKSGGAGSCPDSKAQAKIGKAEAKMRTGICKACGGADKACGGATDQPISSFSWPLFPLPVTQLAFCPGFEGAGVAPIEPSLQTVSNCLVDLNSRAVDQLINLLYSVTPSPDKATLKCQRAVGKNVAKFFQTKSKSLQKCWDGRIKGKHPNDCPSPGDGKAQPKIAAAMAKKDASICKACGGPDKTCNGVDDISPLDIGITSCPAVTVPGGLDCGTIVIASLGDLVACVDCVAEYKADCMDALQVPEFATYGPECTPPLLQSSPASGPCPDIMEVEVGGGDLDNGFTGISHDADIPSKNLITITVSNCAGTQMPNCGQCDVSGPLANTRIANNQRCSNDASAQCTADSECGLGTCSFFFGNPLPLSAGAVPVCVINRIDGGLAGTVNLDTGESSVNFQLATEVFGGLEVSRPCPTCEGDTIDADGVPDGTCNGGNRAGMACDVTGSSPQFGDVSYDCTTIPGGIWGRISIAMMPLTTGTDSRTLSAASPNCRASGHQSEKCLCDTCATVDLEPCMADSDCPGGAICGGKRCLGGANAGVACTANSECASNACGLPGEGTVPNQCLDSTCSLQVGDTASVQEGQCAGGPFDQLCDQQSFLGCTTDGDCRKGTCSVSGFECAADSDCPSAETCDIPYPSDTCDGKLRDCFMDNGTIGNSVIVGGQAAPPSWGGFIALPTFGALFCEQPVFNSSVNNTAGLPGLGRLTVGATVVLKSTSP